MAAVESVLDESGGIDAEEADKLVRGKESGKPFVVRVGGAEEPATIEVGLEKLKLERGLDVLSEPGFGLLEEIGEWREERLWEFLAREGPGIFGGQWRGWLGGQGCHCVEQLGERA